jgi:hypothetical protein
LKFIRNNTTIPAPEVLDVSSQDEDTQSSWDTLEMSYRVSQFGCVMIGSGNVLNPIHNSEMTEGAHNLTILWLHF